MSKFHTSLALHASLLVGFLFSASGNGGGFHYGVKFTGEVAPFEPTGNERVMIIDEKLNIVLRDGGADVEVHYKMENFSKHLGRKKVTFGFPVETGKEGLVMPEPAGGKKQRMPKPSKKEIALMESQTKKYCSGYTVLIDGKKVKAKYVVEPFAYGGVKKFEGSEVLEGIAGWMVSEIDFAAGQNRDIVIRYHTAYEQKGTTVSSNIYRNAPLFKYRLSTGGVWRGPIRKGRVTVKVDTADAKWVEIKKPAGRFKRAAGSDDTWVWDFEHLEPTLADDIEIVTGPPVSRFRSHDNRSNTIVRTADRWQLEHQQFTAKASSTLAPQGIHNYGAENVIRHGYRTNDLYNAWSEGVEGEGVGEKIALTVKKPLPLDELIIRPGYAETDKLFRANGRPAELAITLNGEHTFSAELKDRNEAQRIVVSGYTKPVKTIELKIKKVYVGEKFTDTCISDITLLGRLPKEPKRYGAR